MVVVLERWYVPRPAGSASEEERPGQERSDAFASVPVRRIYAC